MPFDALTLAAVRHELEQKIIGGRIQGILMPGPLAISLEVYHAGVGRTNLLMSAHPQYARVLLSSSAPGRDPEQHPPLLLLLRKYVRGGTIIGVAQPRHERILALSIAKRLYADKHQEYHSQGDFSDTDDEPEADDDAPVTTIELIIEVMGRLSNVVLVAEDGTVLDALKRIPPSLNRYRVTLPNRPYVAPPPQDKRDPSQTSPNALALELDKAAEQDAVAPAWKALVGGFAGVSPTLAREIMYRAIGDAGAPAKSTARNPALLDAILREMGALFALDESGLWSPGVAWQADNDEERHPLDFAPYRLTHLVERGAQLEPFMSTSEAAEAFFSAVQNYSGHEALKAHVRAEIDELRGREERRLFALNEELHRSQALEQLRLKGEYLLSYMHTLEPGQRQLVLPEMELTIDLDPDISPVDNAQAYFREYRKAKAAHEGLPARITEVEMRLRFFDELLTSLEIAAGYDDIRAVQGELVLARAHFVAPAQVPGTGSKKGKKKPQVKVAQPLRRQTTRGLPLLIGRTASQNEVATFRLASPDDVWFHARNVPGSHVILRTVRPPSAEDIEEAAAAAAAYSSARTDTAVDVLYTDRKFVRKVPNGPPGLVTYRNEQVIRVAPRAPQQERGPSPSST